MKTCELLTSGTLKGVSPSVLKIARFANLFLVALLAGLLVGVFIVELALLDVSASVYTAVEKFKREVFEPIMPVFNTLVIVSGLLVLLLIPDRMPWVFGVTAVGVACTIVATATTLLVVVARQLERPENFKDGREALLLGSCGGWSDGGPMLRSALPSGGRKPRRTKGSFFATT